MHLGLVVFVSRSEQIEPENKACDAGNQKHNPCENNAPETERVAAFEFTEGKAMHVAAYSEKGCHGDQQIFVHAMGFQKAEQDQYKRNIFSEVGVRADCVLKPLVTAAADGNLGAEPVFHHAVG